MGYLPVFFALLLAEICCCKVVLFLVRDVFTHGGGAWITSRPEGLEHANDPCTPGAWILTKTGHFSALSFRLKPSKTPAEAKRGEG